MKQKFTLLPFLLIFFFQVQGQICLTDGITFSNQNQIDSFSINYPGCTEIGGSVRISGTGISNLNGLSNITVIHDSLFIMLNSALTSLTGLNSLKKVNGSVSILSNNKLVDLTGLNFLDSIGKYLWISGNNKLKNMEGLTSLTKLNGRFIIENNKSFRNFEGLNSLTVLGSSIEVISNDSLVSFSGLDSLKSIGGSIDISGNTALSGLSALINVTAINGYLSIWTSPSLISLYGLDNINPNSITSLQLFGSPGLSYCSVKSICDYLSISANPATIVSNGSGCKNRTEIETSCTNKCLTAGYTFHSQQDIDAFAVNFPGCKEILGNVIISGSDISNLNGLSVINSIGGSLRISGNSVLSDFTGLDSLQHIFGYLLIEQNNMLDDLSALSELTYVGGDLAIINNNKLESLSGIDNIAYANIQDLYIENSALLSSCEMKPICNYLAKTPEKASIKNNAVGCNAKNEVINKCNPPASIDNKAVSQITIFPNPASEMVIIKGIREQTNIEIRDLYGRLILSALYIDQDIINLNGISNGIYWVHIESEETKIVKKLIIE